MHRFEKRDASICIDLSPNGAADNSQACQPLETQGKVSQIVLGIHVSFPAAPLGLKSIHIYCVAFLKSMHIDASRFLSLQVVEINSERVVHLTNLQV